MRKITRGGGASPPLEGFAPGAHWGMCPQTPGLPPRNAPVASTEPASLRSRNNPVGGHFLKVESKTHLIKDVEI